MTVRVPVERALLDWARGRSKMDSAELEARFPALEEWESGTKRPTLKQLERFGRATRTPVGYLLLAEPPQERLPVPDFRTVAGAEVGEPSPDLLETIYQCQHRQDWYRDYARARRAPVVEFVGSMSTRVPAEAAASTMREALSFDVSERGGTWTEALKRLIENSDSAGVLVMVNGVVGSNTHRKLDPQEFRGFSLVDERAPLVFVNGADTKAAQIFTLAHELAHLWVGQSGVSDVAPQTIPTGEVEAWCNRVAAEFLVPAYDLQDAAVDRDDLVDALQSLARRFKVSTLVALRRIFDVGLITATEFHVAYEDELGRVMSLVRADSESGGGGNFYNTQPLRVSRRFARAIVESTLEGHTLYRDAFQMLGFKKQSTFDEMAERLGVGR